MRFISILLILLMLLPSAVIALDVSPDNISIDVELGQYYTQVFHVTNDENHSVDVTITVSSALDGKVSFSSTYFSVATNSSEDVTAVISRNDTANGKIFFNDNSTEFEVDVSITGGSPPVTEGLTLVPSKPKSGNNVVFILDERIDGTGYVLCSETGNVYLFDLTDGLGVVNLGKDYGNASVCIYTDTSNYVKEFTIEALSKGEIIIDLPDEIKVKQDANFVVYAFGEPAVATKIKFSSDMDISNITRTTDEEGRATVSFKKSGNYTATVNIYGSIQKEFFYVEPIPLTFSIPDDIKINKEATLSVSEKCTVSITKGDVSWNYNTDDSRKVFFTPPWPGRYTISASTASQSGTKTFVVTADTVIYVKDDDGYPAGIIQADKVYLIQVTDENGNPLTTQVDIFDGGMLLETIDVMGSQIWKTSLDQVVTWRFETRPSDEFYKTSSVEVPGFIPVVTPFIPSDTDDFPYFVLVIVGIVAAVVVLILVFKRDAFSVLIEKLRGGGAPEIPL